MAEDLSEKEGWRRFERAVDAAVKSGPKHRLSKHKPELASSFLFDGKATAALEDSLKRLNDRGFDGRLVNCSLHISKPVQLSPTRLAGNDHIIGWAVQVGSHGGTALAALDGNFRVVATHR
jgi:hypothetical protein